jgi:hypothetical protein
VGILDRFEDRINRVVNGAFAKAFESEVQPVEIAAAIQAEVDEKAVIVGAGRTVVPNRFLVDLSQADYDRLLTYENPLKSEIAAVIREHIVTQRYTTLGQIKIELAVDDDLTTGVFRVTSTAEDDGGEPITTSEQLSSRKGPTVVIDGFVHPLTRTKTIIGRSEAADIQVEDSGVSRKHCEIDLLSTPIVRDLDSTNGTWIHGERITEQKLSEDVDITIGTTVIQFRMR